MGTWGHKTFEDDTACDWIYDLEEASNPKEFLKESLFTGADDDYLEAPDAIAVICASEIINGILNGPRECCNEEATALIEKHKDMDVGDLREECISKLNIVLGGNSELRELWEENEEDYTKWKQEVEELIKKLTTK